MRKPKSPAYMTRSVDYLSICPDAELIAWALYKAATVVAATQAGCKPNPFRDKVRDRLVALAKANLG